MASCWNLALPTFASAYSSISREGSAPAVAVNKIGVDLEARWKRSSISIGGGERLFLPESNLYI
eukprot:448357-Amorphochlora_amoeboformis.AAC.1